MRNNKESDFVISFYYYKILLEKQINLYMTMLHDILKFEKEQHKKP